MNKLTTFLIVVVLVARGALYLYDHKKSKLPQPVYNDSVVHRISPADLAEPRNEKGKAIRVTMTTLTFLLTSDRDLYYYVGPFNGTLNALDLDYAGTFIKAFKENMPPEDLMILIKSGDNTPFKLVIDMLDEMQKNNIPPGHYAEATITTEEMDKIKSIKRTKNG